MPSSRAEIEDLPPATQEQLYSELLDRDAQKELESEADIINWSEEVTVRLASRLHALWNRSAGDCLLDSVLQATWGVFDRDNALRRAMSDSRDEAGHRRPCTGQGGTPLTELSRRLPTGVQPGRTTRLRHSAGGPLGGGG